LSTLDRCEAQLAKPLGPVIQLLDTVIIDTDFVHPQQQQSSISSTRHQYQAENNTLNKKNILTYRSRFTVSITA